MTRAAAYGWIIDVDHLAALEDRERFELTDRAGTVGPRDISQGNRDRLRLLRGDQVAHRWRAKDDDGNLYYEGRYVGPGDERMFAPLDDFARPDAGAVAIEYLNAQTGAWEPL